MMRAKEKIERLRAEIEKQLIPLIDSDYVLWDLPYHTNIGDTLIWQGEWNFLRSCLINVSDIRHVIHALFQNCL